MNIAIIPARGGSKRIPRKNIKEFCGWPIISYPIQEAIKSKLFDEILVLTDIYDIAEVAVTFGATIPYFRDITTGNDSATLVGVINEFINNYQDKLPNNICCILPTAVFITSDDLFNSRNRLYFDKLDSVISVKKYEHPIERAFKIDWNTGYLYMEHSEYELTRTQDLFPSYHDAGQFYWLNTDSFIKQKKIFMKKSVGYEIDSVDIDTEEDWKLAELKYKLKKGLIAE